MALSVEQEEYLKKHPLMERLTWTGVDDLYNHFVYGAYTIDQCIELDANRSAYYKKMKQSFSEGRSFIDCSEELGRRRERCVDENGVGEAAW